MEIKRIKMADVSGKKQTSRIACASGEILLSKKTYEAVKKGNVPKGDIFATAQIAAINAVKQTQFLIPLCHNVPVFFTDVSFNLSKNRIKVELCVKTDAKTGVEMEAMTGVSVALLTLYDMLKPIDRTLVISDIKLLLKSGGKSGLWKREK